MSFTENFKCIRTFKYNMFELKPIVEYFYKKMIKMSLNYFMVLLYANI